MLDLALPLDIKDQDVNEINDLQKNLSGWWAQEVGFCLVSSDFEVALDNLLGGTKHVAAENKPSLSL